MNSQADLLDFFEFEVSEEDFREFTRLDQFLVSKLPQYSRSLIKKFFEQGQIKSEVKLSLNKLPAQGTLLCLEIPPALDWNLEPENIPLEILYEDEFLIIINKPAGLVVHPGAGNWSGTLCHALLYHCKDLKGVGHVKRPGIVHRLDKGTSGVMVVAKEQCCHEKLVQLFSQHDIIRKYEALTVGKLLEGHRKIESMIGRHPQHRIKMSTKTNQGKRALTYMSILNSFDRLHHIECRLETGRTHQIRVHCAEILKTPILMDSLYANIPQQFSQLDAGLVDLVKDYPYPFLHAKCLGFKHPMNGEEMYWEVEVPEIFKKVLGQKKEGL